MENLIVITLTTMKHMLCKHDNLYIILYLDNLGIFVYVVSFNLYIKTDIIQD